MSIQDFENMFSNISSYATRRSLLVQDVTAVLFNYFNELHEIEKKTASYVKRGYPRDEESVLIREKKEVHKKYWANDDIYYVPNGLSSSEIYNWADVTDLEVIQNHDSEKRKAICRIKNKDGIHIYQVCFTSEGIKIEHHFF